MVDIPDSLRALFSTRVLEEDGSLYISIPVEEVEKGEITEGETYRFAMMGTVGDASEEPNPGTDGYGEGETVEISNSNDEPPVEEGEIRKVSIEDAGKRGDGIAKVERGYVVIVPETAPGEEPTVRIERIEPNFAMASVVKHDH